MCVCVCVVFRRCFGLYQVISSGNHGAAVSDQGHCSSELPHTCWGESVPLTAHINTSTNSRIVIDIGTSLRRWSRPAFTLWEGAQKCLRTRNALTLAGGAAAEREAKEQRGRVFAPWPLALGQGSVSGGGLLRTRCSSCSCM